MNNNGDIEGIRVEKNNQLNGVMIWRGQSKDESTRNEQERSRETWRRLMYILKFYNLNNRMQINWI